MVGFVYYSVQPSLPPSLYISLKKVGKGFLRVVRCDEFRKADFVPVDLVNNFLIAIGWITGTSPSPSPIFYNYSSSTLNPMSWIQLCESYLTPLEPRHLTLLALQTGAFDSIPTIIKVLMMIF